LLERDQRSPFSIRVLSSSELLSCRRFITFSFSPDVQALKSSFCFPSRFIWASFLLIEKKKKKKKKKVEGGRRGSKGKFEKDETRGWEAKLKMIRKIKENQRKRVHKMKCKRKEEEERRKGGKGGKGEAERKRGTGCHYMLQIKDQLSAKDQSKISQRSVKDQSNVHHGFLTSLLLWSEGSFLFSSLSCFPSNAL